MLLGALAAMLHRTQKLPVQPHQARFHEKARLVKSAAASGATTSEASS
jgi:hypothetical protein